jgi:hypothetical protein
MLNSREDQDVLRRCSAAFNAVSLVTRDRSVFQYRIAATAR